MSSLQTNVNSLFGQENLRVNNEFQARTIQRLTSGFRINSSGDDAAGLAIANKFRADVAELLQGVRNANDGISALQIVDGGLNNISKTIDRLKTLATQSASTTFTGDRATLNNEYQALLTEINRQASNIGLVSGGRYNSNIGVYIGGGSSQANAQVSIDLSGASNQVDSTGLALTGTNVSGGGTALTGNSVRLDNTATVFLAGSATQAFTFRLYNTSAQATQNVTVTVTGTAAGLSGTDVITQLNSSLSQYGISASVVGSGSDIGELQFGGATPFTVTVAAASAGNAVATAASTAENDANYRVASSQLAFVAVTVGSEIVTFQNANGSVNVTFDTTTGATVAAAIAAINAQTVALGITAVNDAAGTGI
ncbi:MAG: flagellin, partial [Bryobacteraceae bacterium]